MKAKRFKAEPFVVRAYCDCGGEFFRDVNAGVLMSNPPKYVHYCNTCSKKEIFKDAYPYNGVVSTDVLIDEEEI